MTNNSIEYNYASSVSLMNDRLGGTTSDYDTGNIRYYGASPNNYIYFNCSDYSNQSADTCELWRIIEVFDDKVKIIRNESIGDFSWDNKPSNIGSSTNYYGSNEWTDARLMILLNPGFEEISNKLSDIYSYEGSLYWNSGSGTCYAGSSNGTTSCDFTSTGLKNDTTRNMIEEVTWNLGGLNTIESFSNEVYFFERGKIVYSGRQTSWTGKIALMYLSDYGYAADFTECSQNLYNYSSSKECQSNDWLYSLYQWVLTPSSSVSTAAWCVLIPTDIASTESSSDTNYVNEDDYFASNVYGVRPTLYISADLGIESGDGSSSLPYRLSVS